MAEPLAVIPLQYAQDGITTRPFKWLRRGVLAAWLACLIASILIVAMDVETVVVSGPVIFLLGLAILITAMRVRSPWHAVIGAGHCAICLLFFMFAWWLDWGPGRASVPFAVMGVVYTLVSGAMTCWLIMRSRMPATS